MDSTTGVCNSTCSQIITTYLKVLGSAQHLLIAVTACVPLLDGCQVAGYGSDTERH